MNVRRGKMQGTEFLGRTPTSYSVPSHTSALMPVAPLVHIPQIVPLFDVPDKQYPAAAAVGTATAPAIGTATARAAALSQLAAAPHCVAHTRKRSPVTGWYSARCPPSPWEAEAPEGLICSAPARAAPPSWPPPSNPGPSSPSPHPPETSPPPPRLCRPTP